MATRKKSKHGGKRKGAGRKKQEPTKVIRVPESMQDAIVDFIKDKANGKKST